MSRGRELLASPGELLVLTSVDYSALDFVVALGARPAEFCFLHSQAKNVSQRNPWKLSFLQKWKSKPQSRARYHFVDILTTARSQRSPDAPWCVTSQKSKFITGVLWGTWTFPPWWWTWAELGTPTTETLSPGECAGCQAWSKISFFVQKERIKCNVHC